VTWAFTATRLDLPCRLEKSCARPLILRNQLLAIRPNGRNRRISPVVAHPGDRLLSEPTAGIEPCRREPLFMPTKVEVNAPVGLSVDLDGNIVFADTGNALIRAYVPPTTHVIDDLAGSVVNDLPQPGFNGDGYCGTETELLEPWGVTATRGALLVVADSANRRIRQVGPCPVSTSVGGRRAEVLVSCRPGRIWSCRRLPVTPGTAATANTGAVTISHEGIVLATGQQLGLLQGRIRFLVTEQRPLVPGQYQLTVERAEGRTQELMVMAKGAP
jgi:hypothetical protein